MKKKFLSIVLFLLFSAKAIAHSEHNIDFNSLEYELFRNNKSIGYHNYNFERNKNYLNVKSIMDFKITKLGIDLYSYYGSTEEKYKKNQLIKFLSNTNQNKKIKNTEITFNKEKDKLIISGSENQLISPKEYLVGTWWNHEIIQAKAQISAISGRIIDQKVIFLGKEKITLYGKTYDTLHFNLLSTDKSLSESKKLNIDVWYDEHTNIWLKAAFDKTGHWEYRLKNIN
tara:strand:- start:16 stop:699 length:684 start_codon:yes stop_codon:yes gene_type:complete